MSQPDETKHIERFVSSHPVVLFGRYTCEYTAKARQLLQEMRVPFKEVDIEAQADGGQHLWDALKAKTGQNTTPYVFINKQFEQGFDHLKEMKDKGELQQKLRAAGVEVA